MSDQTPGTERPYRVDAEWNRTVFARRTGQVAAFAPHRVLRNKAVSEWEAAGRPAPGQRPGEGSVIGTVPAREGATADVRRYSTLWPIPGFVGDLEYVALYAGESCAFVQDIMPAAEIVSGLVQEAEAALQQLRA